MTWVEQLASTATAPAVVAHTFESSRGCPRCGSESPSMRAMDEESFNVSSHVPVPCRICQALQVDTQHRSPSLRDTKALILAFVAFKTLTELGSFVTSILSHLMRR